MKRHLQLCAFALLCACESPPGASPTRTLAVLDQADKTSLDALRASLADAMELADVTLGPIDLTQTSTISVLPPKLGPHDTRSPALPTQFDLMIEDDDCVVVRRDTGESFAVKDLKCRASVD
ncbi:MAG: hypothetical protein AAGB25_10285 [Pseudomonadota bacterium]